VESLVSLSWCIRQGTRGEGDGDADYLDLYLISTMRLTVDNDKLQQNVWDVMFDDFLHQLVSGSV